METVLPPGRLMGSINLEGFLLLAGCSTLLLAVTTFHTLFSHGSSAACPLLFLSLSALVSLFLLWHVYISL